MRILLDENMDERLVAVLNALGHETHHVNQTPFRGASDQVIVGLAQSYDVLVTLDLHRQEAEWVSVNLALIRANVKVLRVRLPRQKANVLMDVVRSLIYRMEWWIAELAAGKSLITIRELGTVERARTRGEVLRMVQDRVEE